MMNLVIVAGGLGSRLAPLTNHIPKFLVNIGKNTGYVEMIRYWKDQLDLSNTDDSMRTGSLTVIVHSQYAAIVEAYHKMYFPAFDITVKTVDEARGSAHAILSSCQHLDGEGALFTWCDIIPAEPIYIEALVRQEENVVFTNYSNSNRYELVAKTCGTRDMKVQLSPTERGGCFGLYYIANYHSNVTFVDGQDFIDIIHQYGNLVEWRLESIVDFGDMPKLIRTRSKSDEAREFNSVETIGDYVLKAATNEQGKAIIERETQWYETLEQNLEVSEAIHRPPVPRAWIGTDKTSFFMSRVRGVPIWKAWPDLSPVDRYHVTRQVIVGEDQLFNLKTYEPLRQNVLRDIEAEAGTKLHNRYTEIEAMIRGFGKVRVVNGFELSMNDPHDTINALSSALEEHYITRRLKYGFIHGDLQFSNSMVDLDTLKVVIIDPRGYFGKTVGSGLQDYDIGKLLYALSGYDTFNYDKNFGIQALGSGEIRFEIPEPSHEGIESVMQDHFKSIHYGWAAVNFIGLAQYIRNDPVKSVCAHYHGLVLAEKWLRSIGN